MLKQFNVPNLTVRFAENDTERNAAQRLRYRVFVEELGALAQEADHLRALEADRFDPLAQHLCVFEQSLQESDPENAVKACLRLYSPQNLPEASGFYSETEFDLAAIHALDANVTEIGRFCVHPSLRNGIGVGMLWKALAEYVERAEIDYLIGTASYHGTGLDDKLESLSYLMALYLAPPHERAYVKPEGALRFSPLPLSEVSAFRAMRDTPGLIKSYLRLGGRLGEGAYVDLDFNTIDVFVLLETKGLKKLKNLP